MATEPLLAFEVLSSVAYLAQFASFRETPDCYTHGAKVSSPTLGPVDVFVKFYVTEKNRTNRGLVNEAVGYLLAKACGLPVAPHAFVIDVSGQRLLEAHASLRGSINAAHSYPCWATSAVDGAQAKQNHGLVIDTLRKWSLLPKMLAFDDWVANSDRTAANIVCTGKQNLTLIDHGHIGGSLYWMPDLLPAEGSFSSPVLLDIWPKALPPAIASQMVQNAAEHGRVFSVAKARLRAVLDFCCDDQPSSRAFEEFLEKRANGSYDRIKKTHGVLI